MKFKRRSNKLWGAICALTLAAFLFTACGVNGLAAQAATGTLSICHATGDAASPYEEMTIEVAALLEHADHANDLIPAPADGCPSEVQTGANDGKLEICHATGSANNPYEEIRIDFNGLRGHLNHAGDIIPAPADGCPSRPLTTGTPGTLTETMTPATLTETPTPTLTETPAGAETATVVATATVAASGTITICHATGSKKNPYVEITVSVNGLNGHGKHKGDIIPAPAGGCPKGG
jgi:hypothetical protein